MVLDGQLNGLGYQENMLKNVVWPRVQHIPRCRLQFHYMHDRAPCHQSKVATAYLEKQRIQTLLWPTNSPDFNLIENLWIHLKQSINNRRQIPANADELRQIIKEEWGKIDKKEWRKILVSMPWRMEACIKAEGRSTRW